MKAVLSQAVAIYRDAPRWGDERKRLADLVKALPWRMTKGRIEPNQQKAFGRASACPSVPLIEDEKIGIHVPAETAGRSAVRADGAGRGFIGTQMPISPFALAARS
ncbi:hypothetical protein [Mesorhizobium sp. B2-6-1]|uniref:hypothetical protein n=1 Tax=Mesorhizobium sp. B2-6-1 TaxID=2589916 RepID=UPI00112963B1|nr:hypothetical protein [Mesorhizobium sp. B2-6-1]TPJ57783.1 hypothetical protein FJ443_28545 [Mesorhizobium sp. B2-6-1]